MPDAGNNSTKSRLSEFIKGCTQLKEIYAVTPLEYTNIMGEWWQRINDLIYTLGLTETHDTPVTIAWTVPVPGRKRSPFFEEEIATKKPDGTDVPENSRVSKVGGTGTTFDGTETKRIKAHKFGLVQSIDKLLQRNINTWGSLYSYFYNKTHNPDDTLKTGTSIGEPADLAEMLFGARDRTDADTDDIFGRACRNLHGDSQGLANSLMHVIEDIFSSAFYDWLDKLSPVQGSRPIGGLRQFFFNGNANFSQVWDRFTTGGLATETVKIIDRIGLPFYEWLTDTNKRCMVESTTKRQQLWRRLNGNWARLNQTRYDYKGHSQNEYNLPVPTYNSKQYLYPSTLTSTTAQQAENPSSTAAIKTVSGNSSVTTMESLIKQEFIKYALNGGGGNPSPIRTMVPSPKKGDAACIAVKLNVNSGFFDSEFECSKTGLFAYSGNSWSLIEATYDTIVPGIYQDVTYSVSSSESASKTKTCLLEESKNDSWKISSSDPSPVDIGDLLFGDLAVNETMCSIWKRMSTGSLLKETILLKDAIGEDLIDWFNSVPVCVDGDEPKSGPHNLKELLFGSMAPEELCRGLKSLVGNSIFEEIKNITDFLGKSYVHYIERHNDPVPEPAPLVPIDPATNPMNVIHMMDEGMMLFGAKSKRNPADQAWQADYMVKGVYVCESTEDAEVTIAALNAKNIKDAIIYDIKNDIRWEANASGQYVSTSNAHCINEIYETIGHGRIASNEFTGKIYYIRGDKKQLDHIATTASKLGLSTIGSGIVPIYLNKGVATASTSTVGSGIKPVYLNNGAITVSNSTVGSGIKPVYLTGGTITASTSTVGSETEPIYLTGGTLTKTTTTVGSGTEPIFLSSGKLTKSTSNVGNAKNPVYLSGGKITASGDTVGSTTQLMYMNGGTLTASNATVGSDSVPVYLSNGTITSCDINALRALVTWSFYGEFGLGKWESSKTDTIWNCTPGKPVIFQAKNSDKYFNISFQHVRGGSSLGSLGPGRYITCSYVPIGGDANGDELSCGTSYETFFESVVVIPNSTQLTFSYSARTGMDGYHTFNVYV